MRRMCKVAFQDFGKGKVILMMETGRLCVKVAGREAGKSCIIVDVIDSNFVIIDGQVKRRKVNVDHLEPLHHKLEIDSKSSKAEIEAALESVGVESSVVQKKWKANPKPKTAPQDAGKANVKAVKASKKEA